MFARACDEVNIYGSRAYTRSKHCSLLLSRMKFMSGHEDCTLRTRRNQCNRLFNWLRDTVVYFTQINSQNSFIFFSDSFPE